MGGGSSSSGEGYSRTTPGFMEQLGTVLNARLAGTTGFSKENAIQDTQGVLRQQATTALQESMPKIASQQTQAGAYNSTTKQLLNNDLQARITGQLAQTQLGAIKDYAAIDNDIIRAFAAATQAGTSSESQHWESAASRKGILDGVGGVIVGGALDSIAGDGAQNGGRVPSPEDTTDPSKQFLEKMISTYNLQGAASAVDPTRSQTPLATPTPVSTSSLKSPSIKNPTVGGSNGDDEDSLFTHLAGGM